MLDKEVSIITSCYRGEKYIKFFLENLIKQTILDKIELVLVHNDPSDSELEIVNQYKNNYPNLINHIIVPREPISISMNRAIQNSNGKYIISWDIDDIRTNNSIELQYKILHENNDIYFTYGDFIIIKDYNERKGENIKAIEFNKDEFIRSMHCGPFRAWKKEIHSTIGYFDEQLKSGADFDFVIRVAYNFNMAKTNGLLGYYLNENTGLSTGQNSIISLQQKELYIINKRYNILDKIDFLAKNDIYNIYKIKNGDTFLGIGTFIKNYSIKIPSFTENLNSLIFTIKYGILRIAKFIYLKLK